MFNTGDIFLIPALVRRRSLVIMLAVTLTIAPCAMAQATSAVSNRNPIHVVLSPMNATVRAGGKHQFTALISGTSNTSVTWSTTAGTIDGTGLYTAPAVKSKTDAVVTAVPDADPKQQVSALVTVHPANAEGVLITSSALPQGQQGSMYDEVFTAAGGTTPYSWSVSAGTVPAGTALSANGEFAGTPTTAGNYQFTIMVTDAASKTATGNFSVNVAAGSGYDGPAQLPIGSVNSAVADTPATGQVINVKAGSDLQSALNSAQCGDIIELQAGAAFTGPFNFPAKNCDNDHWIIVRTSAPDSALPAEGTRLTPCYAGLASMPNRPAYPCPNPQNVLARVSYSVRNGSGPIVFMNGANHYRLLGLEITRPADKTPVVSLISVDEGQAANNLIIDRSWIHGTAQDETRRGADLDGATTVAIVDSYFNDFHCVALTGTCVDSQALSGGLGNVSQGTWKIEDNFLEAAAESIELGGGASTVVPTDITIDRNHFYKVPQWQPGTPGFIGGYDGDPFVVKNHFEIKNASRVLLEGNLFEYNWGGFSQAGDSIIIGPRNDFSKQRQVGNLCSVCQGTDVTIRYNWIRHVAAGINLASVMVHGVAAAAAGRISIHDDVIDDVQAVRYLGRGTLFLVMNGWPTSVLNSITIQHVTGFPDPYHNLMMIGNELSDPQMYGFVFSNNLLTTGQYPVWSVGKTDDCSKSDVPLPVITKCFATSNFTSNVLAGTSAAFPPSKWPTENMFPATANDVGFVNFNNGNGGDYALLSSSPYKGKASDGTDPGANFGAVTAAIQGVE